jgi:hypothetical protein
MSLRIDTIAARRRFNPASRCPFDLDVFLDELRPATTPKTKTKRKPARKPRRVRPQVARISG